MPGFVVAEMFVLNIQVRRETQTISFSDIPLVLGLFFAAPLAVLVGRVLASGGVMLVHRKSPPLKVAFNVALLTAETSVAIAIFPRSPPAHHAAAPSPGWAPTAARWPRTRWARSPSAAVIAVYEGAVRRAVAAAQTASQAVPAMGVTLGLLAVAHA